MSKMASMIEVVSALVMEGAGEEGEHRSLLVRELEAD